MHGYKVCWFCPCNLHICVSVWCVCFPLKSKPQHFIDILPLNCYQMQMAGLCCVTLLYVTLRAQIRTHTVWLCMRYRFWQLLLRLWVLAIVVCNAGCWLVDTSQVFLLTSTTAIALFYSLISIKAHTFNANVYIFYFIQIHMQFQACKWLCVLRKCGLITSEDARNQLEILWLPQAFSRTRM